MNPDKPWNWNEISVNPNISWDNIQKNPDKPWNWSHISRSPNVSWDNIQRNPDRPWNWTSVSSNPNITFDIIQSNPGKPWSWYRIIRNTFTKEKEEIDELFQLRMANQKFVRDHLWEELVKYVYHPSRILKYLDQGYDIFELDGIM